MLLGLDLASRLTGYCVGDGLTIPECGAWSFDSSEGVHYGRPLASLRGCLNILKERRPFGRAAFEAPIWKPGDTLHKLRLLYPLPAFVELWCDDEAIPCEEVTVQQAKQIVTGDQNGSKDLIVAAARACGLRLPDGDGEKDAADGWAVWLCLLRDADPITFSRWDRKLHQLRGALL